jgi:two-component system, cell cycle sensor histidine kinase and response regulator CckA
MTILAVDDNPDGLVLLSAIFSPSGDIVQTAANGEVALAWLKSSAPDNLPDLIISDILMPGMDGYAFCIKCKETPGLDKIPFIFYSSTYTDVKDEQFAYSLGADLFLRKPLDPEVLQQEVKQLISQRGIEKKSFRRLPKEQETTLNPLNNEKETYRLYSERLVHKLEQKMADLERSEALYSTLMNDVLDTSRVGLLIVNSDHRIIWGNTMVETFFDIDRTALENMDLESFYRGPFADTLLDPGKNLPRIIQSVRSSTCLSGITCAMRNRRPGSTRRIAEYWSQPIQTGLYKGGRIEHFLDVTARKLLEEQLEQVQKLESIGFMATGIVHDFNNLLGAILGNAELIGEDIAEKRSSAEQLLTGVQEIIRAGEQGRSMISRLLAFTRRSPEPVREVIPLKSVIVDVVQMLNRSVPEKVKISLNLSTDACIMADYTQMVQVIMNLCINALQAMGNMDSGTITIDLRDGTATPELPPGHLEKQLEKYASLTIQDTGPGIDQTVIPHIFEPFFTTRPRGEGTGMGLSVVQNIIQSCGGSITADSLVTRDSTLAQDSTQSYGARFTIYLPAVPCQ